MNTDEGSFYNKTKDIFRYISESTINNITASINVFSNLLKTFFDNFENPEFKKCVIKFSGLLFFIIFTGIILYYAVNDRDILSNKQILYAFLVAIPLLLIVGLVMGVFSNKATATSFLTLLFAVGVLIASVYFYMNLKSKYDYVIAYLINGISLLIVIFGLSILANIFINNMKKATGWKGFIINFIFFIPCLVSDFIKYILQQFAITPNIVFVLFIIEILLILSYIYIPRFINDTIITNSKNSIILMNKPQFIDSENVIGKSYELFKDNVDASGNVTSPRNYTISFWLYLNNESMEYSDSYNKETVIFKYGNNTSVKPMLTYFNDVTLDRNERSKNAYNLYFATTENGVNHKISIPNQRWNNFVFNYNDGIVDVFINGILERSFEFGTIIPDYSNAKDVFTIGSNNGVNGAICNVIYHKIPLTESQIITNYNLYMNYNPPINSYLTDK